MKEGQFVMDLAGDLGVGKVTNIYTNDNCGPCPVEMLTINFSGDQIFDRLPNEVLIISYVKLPNGANVLVDERGFISVTVEVNLSDLINHDSEGVLDLLSEKATGTELLSDISYSVIGHSGNTLSILVTGDIDLIDVESCEDAVNPAAAADFPEKSWKIEIRRAGYGFHEINVTAKTTAEAIEKAQDVAGDLEYSEKSSEYSFQTSLA